MTQLVGHRDEMTGGGSCKRKPVEEGVAGEEVDSCSSTSFMERERERERERVCMNVMCM